MHEKYKIITPISHVPVVHPAIFWDNGDCTFNYDSGGDGADWSAAYNTAAAHSCLNGIRLSTRATGPTVADSVWIMKYLWLPPTYLFTLEFLFKNITFATNRLFYAGVRWYDGTNVYAVLLRFDSSSGNVHYFAGGVTYTILTGIAFCSTADTWNHVRLSARIHQALFEYITVNNNVYDARAIPIPANANAAAAHLELYFAVETGANAVRTTDLDHILLMPGNP